MILLRLITALGALTCCWLVAFLTTSKPLRGIEVTARYLAAVCLTFWLAAWTFQILGLLGWFRLGVVVPLCVLLPAGILWVRRRRLRGMLLRARVEMHTEWRQLGHEIRTSRWVAVGLALLTAHLVVRMARALSTPTFGWDDFTYHLFRAGRWVQNGGLALEPAPDAWTYYEFFPWGGDLVWAWALVWRVSDVLVPLAAIAFWGAALLAGYVLARELGQGRLTALIVALAVALLPSQVSQLNTAYVDNAVLAMVLATSAFLLVLLSKDSSGGSAGGNAVEAPWASFLVGASCGLGLLVKMSFLPLLVPAGIIVVWRALRRRQLVPILGFAAGAAVVVPNLVFNWVHRGSPFYPFQILDSLPFNDQHSWILGKYGEGATPAELLRAGKSLVVNLFPLDPFLNVGFLGAVLLVLGLGGCLAFTRSVRGRWFLLWALTGALITVLNFFSPRNSSMVAWWTLTMGRFLVPSLAGLLVASGIAGAAVARKMIFPLLLLEYFFYASRKWPVEIATATLQVTALLAVVIGMAVLLSRWRNKPLPGWPLMAVLVSLALVAVIGVRERVRYDAYRLHSERRLLDFHGVPPMEAWPIWQRVDQAGPTRVAVTAGFDGLTGHNWFRWPLLGAWLQNEVVYLPITADGALVSYLDRDRLRAAGDRSAWLARLRDRELEWVVALGPATLEHQWILELPEIFSLEVTMGNGHYLLARLDHEQLARALRESS